MATYNTETPDYNQSGELTSLGSNTTQAEELLLGQYKDSEVLKALLGSYAAQLDALQTATLEVHYERWISNAVGIQLDVIGNIVVEPRNGRDDDDYRRAIQSRILVNKSNGKIEELINIALVHEPNLEQYFFGQYYPNAIVAELLGPLLDEPQQLAGRLQDASAGGVNIHVVTLSASLDSALLCSDAQDTLTYDNHNGFATIPAQEPPVFGGLATNVIKKYY